MGKELLIIRRSSGDPTLFDMVCRMLLEFDMGRGEAPNDFFDGQMLPRIRRTCSPPLLDVPPLDLDQAGVKRKLADR